jgi:hypothetical protein
MTGVAPGQEITHRHRQKAIRHAATRGGHGAPRKARLKKIGRGFPRLKSWEESALRISRYTFTPRTAILNICCAMEGTKQEHLLRITAIHRRKRHHSAATLLPGPPSTGLLRSAPQHAGERWNREACKEHDAIYGIMPPTFSRG